MENKKAFEIAKTVIKAYENMGEKKFQYYYSNDIEFHNKVQMAIENLTEKDD